MKKIILSIVLFSFPFYMSLAQDCFSTVIKSSKSTSGYFSNNLYGVTYADFNKDGKIDIVTANIFKNSISLMNGNGLGGFSAPTDFFSATEPTSVINADFNNDGKIDLAVNYFSYNKFVILLGNGSGGFSAPTYFSKPLVSSSIISGDFNGDGKIDLVIYDGLSNPTNITVMIGDGTGGFTEGNSFFSGISQITNMISDNFNGDTKKDLAIIYRSGTVQIFFGDGYGNFSLASTFDSGCGMAAQIISDDFNADGKKDMAISGFEKVTVCLNDGTGAFPNKNILNLGANISGVSLTSTDLNGDGKKDIAIATTDRIQIRYNIGSGNFSARNDYDINSDGQNPTFIFSADFNGDGKQDLATDNRTYDSTTIPNTIRVLLGSSSITFNKIDVTCNGGNNGSAKATANCINPRSYSWNTIPVQNTQTAIGLSAGTYTVTITDSSNIKTSGSIIITEPPLITATFTTSPNRKCSGTCDGAITINASGGTLPYSYKWDALANNQTTQTTTGLCSGKYTVTITDAKSCIVNKEVIETSESGFNSQVYLTNIAAVDQVNVSPAFASYHTYNLPAKITPNPTNLRNFVDPGKKARFKVECTNKKANGQSIVSGVCQVRSNCPYITITDASSALNNIGWNNKAWSADEFEIDIKPNTPPGTIAYIDFIVLENGIEYPTTCIPLPITPLNYSPTTSATIDDDDNPDSKGNDNDICEPNEIIEFYPWLDNVSALNAEYVRGRFENLDNLSYINIWNNKAGVNTTVFDSTWWNFSFAQPAIINSNSKDMTPEFDFVFNYNNSNIVNNFKLHMVMAGGFKLFPGNALSLVQWSLPYTFNSSSLAVDNFLVNNALLIYPNPTNSFLNIKSFNTTFFEKIVITDLTGKIILEQSENTNQINVKNLANGMYFLKAKINDKTITRKFIKQ